MARFTSKRVIQQTAVLACGATNADNVLDIVVPSPSATLLQVAATQKTAAAGGTVTGTFSIQVKYGATPTAIGPASATNLIDADGVAGVVHGVLSVRTSLANQEGKLLYITTVKAGTIDNNATVIYTFTWLV